MKGFKLLLVFAFVGAGIYLSFKGECRGDLNGILAGIALIQAFVIYNYEADLENKRRKVK